MQDRTINNALLALVRRRDEQSDLAEQLLKLRGVSVPKVYQFNPFRRGECAKLVIGVLQQGPMTCPQVTDALTDHRPDLTRRRLNHRVYKALRRLEERGVVECVKLQNEIYWRVAKCPLRYYYTSHGGQRCNFAITMAS